MEDGNIDLDNEILKITLSLYNNPLIPRKVVQFFIDTLLFFTYKLFLPSLIFQLKLLNTDDKVMHDINRIAEASKEIFEAYKNEHNRLKTYKEKGLLIDPQKFEIDSKSGASAYFVPLRWTLKKFLEIPGAFHLLKKSTEKFYAENDIIHNFVQGDFWKEKLREFPPNKFYIPLFMFYDDIEVGNTLGSHAGSNKIGAIYFSIPSFPSSVSSKLQNIFVNTLCYAKDRSDFGNAKVFHKIVNELNDLRENGMSLNIQGKTETVYFQLSLLLGDNLGLNALLGFFESFNSKCPCRVCKAFIDDIKTMTKEDPTLIRKKEDYEKDCEENNQNATGISERCFFNKVTGFHVTENITLDLMHDNFEGFGNTTMVKILKYLIFDNNVFDLDHLNKVIQKFDYGSYTESNKIPIIKKEHILQKEKLKMSASECLCFIRYFGLLVGDRVPEDDPVWAIYIKLREIVDYVTSPRLVRGYYATFERLTADFLEMYKDEFKEDFTFKLHNLIHVLRVMKNNGFLVLFWSMRYESKHRHLKSIFLTAMNKLNTLYTISLRCQLMLAYTILFEDLSVEKISFESPKPVPVIYRQTYFPNDTEAEIVSVSHINHEGIDYAVDGVFVTEMGDNDLLNFGQISDIYVKNRAEIYLFMRQYSSSQTLFDDHCHAYLVHESKNLFLKKSIDLPSVHPCIMHKKDSEVYVATKYKL